MLSCNYHNDHCLALNVVVLRRFLAVLNIVQMNMIEITIFEKGKGPQEPPVAIEKTTLPRKSNVYI